MNLAIWISQNAVWIALVIIFFIVAWKLLNWVADNEKKIDKFKSKLNKISNSLHRKHGTTKQGTETTGNN